MDDGESFPEEIFTRIIFYLSWKSALAARLVSRGWCYLATHDCPALHQRVVDRARSWQKSYFDKMDTPLQRVMRREYIFKWIPPSVVTQLLCPQMDTLNDLKDVAHCPVDAVKSVLDYYALFNDSRWMSLGLYYAVQCANVGQVQYYLDHGACADGQIQNELRPIISAARLGSTEIIEQLHKAGVALDESVVQQAVRYQNWHTVQWLLEHGAPWTRPIAYSEYLDVKMCAYLADHGFTMNVWEWAQLIQQDALCETHKFRTFAPPSRGEELQLYRYAIEKLAAKKTIALQWLQREHPIKPIEFGEIPEDFVCNYLPALLKNQLLTNNPVWMRMCKRRDQTDSINLLLAAGFV